MVKVTSSKETHLCLKVDQSEKEDELLVGNLMEHEVHTFII